MERRTLKYINYPIPFPNKVHRVYDKSRSAMGTYFCLLEVCYVRETSEIPYQDAVDELCIPEVEFKEELDLLSSSKLIRVLEGVIVCVEVEST